MNIIESIIFGIVEGVTEFLPISSTAHLEITRMFLNLPLTEFIKTFEIVIQLGAILAIVYLYKDKLFTSTVYLKKILIAFIPTGIIGYILYSLIKKYFFGNTILMLIALFTGGILILFFEKFYNKKESNKKSIEDLTNKNLIILGITQALAVIPGVSRSLAVILCGQALRIDKKTITEFSFLLAIPTMLSATVYDLYKNGVNFAKGDWMDLSIGFVVSFFVALFVVKWLLDYIKNNSFVMFGWYRIILSIILFLLFINY